MLDSEEHKQMTGNVNPTKLDLVMWTLNGAATLPLCLRSIEKAIPEEGVNQKIIIDGGSTDDSKTIAEKFNWQVIDAERCGIQHQANQALKLVKTELFASFEQDVVINPSWYETILKHFEDPNVAVAQGIRFCVNPTIRNIEKCAINNKQQTYSSLDNTLCRTNIIKAVGGYNPKYVLSGDRDLQERVRQHGYKWIVDKSIISDHLKTSIRRYAIDIRQHAMENCNYTKRKVGIFKLFQMFVLSPFRGITIATKSRCPNAFFVYPYCRLQWLLGGMK